MAVCKIAGVERGLIMSITNLSVATRWNNVKVEPNTAVDTEDGKSNANLIISQFRNISSAGQLCND